jgi:hypothetical protein
MYLATANTLGFTTAGTEKLQIGSTGALVLASNVYHQSPAGVDRLNFQTTSTMYNSPNYHSWRSTVSGTSDRMSLAFNDLPNGVTDFSLAAADGSYFNMYLGNAAWNGGTFFNQSKVAGGFVFRCAAVDSMFLTGSTTLVGFDGLTLPRGGAQKPSGGSWASYSDRRLKANIELANTEQCYNIVKSLPLQRFEFIPEYVANTSVQDTRVVGWIADDVEQIFPKAVMTTKGFGYEDLKTLDVDQLYKTMWGAITKLVEKVESLEAQVVALQTQS